MNKPDYKKIIQILNYIAGKFEGNVKYMKALKLLYFADRLHLREYGRLITDDNLIAMKNGTLGSQARDIATKSKYLPHIVYEYVSDKLIRNDDFTITQNFDETDQLSETDINCVNKIISDLGELSQYELAELTHKLPEFKNSFERVNESVVDLDVLELFSKTDDKVLNKIYSQSEEEISLSRSLFLESLDQKAQLV